MTELAETPPEVSEQQDGGFESRTDGTLASFVDRLREESERLVSLANACDANAHELAEREASVDAREQTLGARERELDIRHDELERWQQQLNELAAETQHANARIAEAAEREAELRTLAHNLLQRYSDAPSGTSSPPTP